MKYLSRNKIYEKVNSFKNAKKVYLFCEGDKEVNYFKFFQGFASNIDIIPIPNDNGKSDPIKLAKKLIRGEYDRPLILKFGDRYHLVAGNTRLSTAAALGITPIVLIGELKNY
jgi:hypothetical protein